MTRMKREEAIKLLHEISDQCCEISNILCTEDSDKKCEAVDMAIEALQADVVSREEYEDIIKDYRKQYENMNNEIADLEDKLSVDAEWIPCSERLPKENEYVGDVCKYYLIQDEYGDMHVAHLSSRGWETIESVKALGCDVVAWMPLPKPKQSALHKSK